VTFILEAYAREHNVDLHDLPVVIQGFGNVGSFAAKEAAERGCRVVGTSDMYGGIYSADGLNVQALFAHVKGGGKVNEFSGTHDNVTNEELLESPCAVLIPAALDEQIHQGNAEHIQAQAVIEAANYPTTPNADKILHDRGIIVVPDILANAGGVTGSYFEWTANIQQRQWSEQRFNDTLHEYMTRAYDTASAFARERDCTLRQASFAIGISRVAEAEKMRGYI
jgi:glutamate dehydrogenase (NAD(P)+)